MSEKEELLKELEKVKKELAEAKTKINELTPPKFKVSHTVVFTPKLEKGG